MIFLQENCAHLGLLSLSLPLTSRLLKGAYAACVISRECLSAFPLPGGVSLKDPSLDSLKDDQRYRIRLISRSIESRIFHSLELHTAQLTNGQC